MPGKSLRFSAAERENSAPFMERETEEKARTIRTGLQLRVLRLGFL